MEKMKTANKRNLWLTNFQAGTTTAVMLIPQGMAYALVAGLPPIHGLYASLAPLFLYAMIGQSRELAVGPGALDTLLVGTTLGTLAFVNEQNYVVMAAFVALQVSCIQLALSLFRGGFLVNFLSRPVISGFTSAAALVIGFSQMPNLFGFQSEKTAQFHVLVWQTLKKLPESNPYTTIVGLGSVFLLMLMKRKWRQFPRALFVVIFSILCVKGLGLQGKNVAIVGSIPTGLPNFIVPPLVWENFMALFPTSLALAFVGYLTMISIAKTFSDRNRYDINANRELLAAGAANFAAGLFQGFPVSASFSRSAVHASAGSTSPYALMISATWIGLTLLFLTDLFYFLPKATLAAIIITAVFGLIDKHAPFELYKVKRADMILLFITFFSTLAIGIESGILIGVGSSLALFLYRSTNPHVAVLGRLNHSTDYRNIKNFPEAETTDGLLVIRIDAQFYFGNVTFLKELLRRLEKESSIPLTAVVIEACSLTQLDSSADAALHDIADDFEERGINFVFASVKMPVLRVMKASRLFEKVGEHHFFMNVHDAVEYCKQLKMNQTSKRKLSSSLLGQEPCLYA